MAVRPPHREIAGILLALTALATTAEAGLIPRVVPAKPAATARSAGVMRDRLVVKFREGTSVRRRARGLEAPAVDLAPVEQVLRARGIDPVKVQPLFARPVAALDAERARAELASGRALADLNLYYRVAVPAGVDATELADALNALAVVELAAPYPLQAPPPQFDGIPTPTPDFTDFQYYLAPAPLGIGATAVGGIPGADGTGVSVVDVEFGWTLDHEDLQLPTSANIDVAHPLDPELFRDHGTAVLGIIGARENGLGVRGVAPGARKLVAPVYSEDLGYDVGNAVSVAMDVLHPGDVILLEQQIGVCGMYCDGVSGCGPVEDFRPWADVIATATALGIAVVEAAGNGAVNLDGPECYGAFDRSIFDSGAIMVGAGYDRRRLDFSSYGSRVDVQAWGIAVVTTGYGDLFDPSDVRRQYTSYFSGTSSASAIVAGVVAAVQGARLGAASPPLAPRDLRARLRATGTPQAADDFEPFAQIGPLPNLERAILCGNGVVDANETCDDGNGKARDGCSATCEVELCASCAGAPSACVPPEKSCRKCARTIAAEGARFAATRLALLTKCENAKVGGKLASTVDCTANADTAKKLAKSAARLAAKIAAACGGADARCGTQDRGEVDPARLGWPATCPDLRDVACGAPVTDCNGIAACLACTHANAVEGTRAQVFDAMQPSPPSAARLLTKCRQAIGAATSKLFALRGKALQDCWDKRSRLLHADDCASAFGGGSARQAASIRTFEAETKARQRICKACGGKDGQCDDVDDVGPAAIGFPPLCDAVRTPSGVSCIGVVTTLNDVVECLRCVTTADAQCADAIRVPEFLTYPARCTPTPLGSCCDAHEGGGCETDGCTTCVCTHDFFCCRFGWDGICADVAAAQCADQCACSE